MKYIFLVIVIIFSLGSVSSQCNMDRHNTTWFHSWISCETSDNPNSIRGKNHWILYDFGHIYKLEDVQLWNLNDPSQLDNGIKKVIIDYSMDGNTWTEFGEETFEKATGKSIYNGEKAFSFNGIKTRYLLISGKENWGGDCFGFGEIKINVSPITATELVNFDLDCNEKNGYTEVEWSLTNESNSVSFSIEKSLDEKKWNTIHETGNIAIKNDENTYRFLDKSTDDAYYRIKVIENNGKQAYSNIHFCSKSNLKLTAFPNPFIDNIEVELFAQNDEPIIYSLNDIYGRTITKGVIKSNSMINRLKIDDLNLDFGHYFFIARQGNKTGQIKLVKIKVD